MNCPDYLEQTNIFKEDISPTDWRSMALVKERAKEKVKLEMGKSFLTEEELTPGVPVNLVVRTYKSKV